MFKAAKPCNFGERQFFVGDEIPADLIDPNRVKTLVKYGTIINVPEPPEMPPEAPADTTGTDTSPDAGDGKKGDKQALNNAKSTGAAKKTQQAAKKGGK